MRKLRVLCWLLSAYLLCCSAFAAPSANAFYDYESVTNSVISPFAVSSAVTTSISVNATCTTKDSAGTTTVGEKYLAATDDSSTQSYTINGVFDSAEGTLNSWVFKGTVTYIYNLGESQVVTLSGVPNLSLSIKSAVSNGYVLMVNRSPGLIDEESSGFNWTIETDSSVETSIDTPNGWTSGVEISEITLTCSFNFRVVGLNQSFKTLSISQAQISFEVQPGADGLRIGAGGDPNTGILSGIASILSSLIEFIQGIYEAVVNIPDLIQSVISAVTSLPGLIVDGIKNLFIPSQQDLETLKTSYETMLERKLGFVWQVGDWLTSFANTMISAFTGGTSYTFEFPGISFSMNGETHEIVPAQTVSLENAFMSVMRPVLGTAVSFICIIAFIRLGEHMLTAVVSGASYFEFLKGDGG